MVPIRCRKYRGKIPAAPYNKKTYNAVIYHRLKLPQKPLVWKIKRMRKYRWEFSI